MYQVISGLCYAHGPYQGPSCPQYNNWIISNPFAPCPCTTDPQKSEFVRLGIEDTESRVRSGIVEALIRCVKQETLDKIIDLLENIIACKGNTSADGYRDPSNASDFKETILYQIRLKRNEL